MQLQHVWRNLCVRSYCTSWSLITSSSPCKTREGPGVGPIICCKRAGPQVPATTRPVARPGAVDSAATGGGRASRLILHSVGEASLLCVGGLILHSLHLHCLRLVHAHLHHLRDLCRPHRCLELVLGPRILGGLPDLRLISLGRGFLLLFHGARILCRKRIRRQVRSQLDLRGQWQLHRTELSLARLELDELGDRAGDREFLTVLPSFGRCGLILRILVTGRLCRICRRCIVGLGLC
mmetsp:Transcript_67853/g.172261  ORF Transcript_67853/g.172261 Transcript_67853/m.172261 type:complete len:237 (-) Transcript_67853:1211-1921(-)